MWGERGARDTEGKEREGQRPNTDMTGRHTQRTCLCHRRHRDETETRKQEMRDTNKLRGIKELNSTP